MNTDLILTEQDLKEIAKISAKNPTVDKLYSIYQSYIKDPRKGWLNTIILAEAELGKAVQNKNLDIKDDGYHKSLLEILKTGGAVAKTIASAMQEADIKKTEKPDLNEDEEAVVPIRPETAI